MRCRYCDAGLVTIIENKNGNPLNVGRKTRAIPPATGRALLSCGRHHRAVHEFGYRIEHTR